MESGCWTQAGGGIVAAMGVQEFFFFIGSIMVGILATGGYAVIALSPADFRQARVLFFFSGLLGLLLVVVWGMITDAPFSVRLPVVAVLGALIAVLTSEAGHWVYRREVSARTESAAGNPIAPRLLDTQIIELTELDKLIGRKSENELRQMLKFNEMIRYDILYAKIQYGQGVTIEEAKSVDDFFKGGSGLVDVRFCNLTEGDGAMHYEEIPGKFGLLSVCPETY